ncbi:MAG TPA: heavy metal-binding domain-containing protein, partial [Pseudobdellovibrionaceae bacterium]|nr:heavy metal-binding domain-containing protein [Pseudobdellovibrionaceae bacterium]
MHSNHNHSSNQSGSASHTEYGHSHDHHSTTKDPVCGMTVDPNDPKGGQSLFQNVNYYFCNSKCRSKFDLDPQKYIFPTPAKIEQKDIEYTCPMHPEIRQIGPGSCPICGMALEPVTASLDHAGEGQEYLDMKKRFWVGTILSIPLLFITMGGRHLIHNQGLLKLLPWGEVIISSPVILWAGWPFYVRFWQSIKNRSLNMFTLIGLGVAVAYIYSLIAVLFPQLFPDSFRDSMTGEVGLYFEAAAVIVTLVLLGQVLELKARGQTNAAIKALLGLAPKAARKIMPDGSEVEVPLETIQVGDRLRVKPGEKIPVDSKVISGSSSVDES